MEQSNNIGVHAARSKGRCVADTWMDLTIILNAKPTVVPIGVWQKIVIKANDIEDNTNRCIHSNKVRIQRIEECDKLPIFPQSLRSSAINGMSFIGNDRSEITCGLHYNRIVMGI